MRVEHGDGTTEYGPGVDVHLSGEEVATAIMAYLVAYGVHTAGPMTILVNGELIESGRVYVDPEGSVTTKVGKFLGDGTIIP